MGLPVLCTPPGIAVHESVDDKLDQIRAAYRVVRENLNKAAERQKHYYDLRVKPASFQPNDNVWLWTTRRQKGRTPEWQRRLVGPYVVVEKVGPVNYRLRRSAKSKPFVVHVDKLRPYLSPNLRTDRPQLDVNPQTVQSSDDDTDAKDEATMSVSRPERTRRLPARYRE